MPFYEYECMDCSNVFEVIKPLSKIEENEKCPLCQSLNTKRLISKITGVSLFCNTTSKSGG